MRPIESPRTCPTAPTSRASGPWENLCGGAYFYLDEDDRAVVATTDRRILAIATSDADGEPDLTTVDATYDVSDVVPEDDCLIALMPDWDGSIWFETPTAGSATVDPESGEAQVLDLGEEIANSFAVDEQGVYVVTVEALYRLSADRSGKPRGRLARRRTTAAASQKPGQLSQGSGTTPTLLADGLVAITDNADPRMHVVFLRRDTGEEVCAAPVFGDDAQRHRQLARRRRTRRRRGREQPRLLQPAQHRPRPRHRLPAWPGSTSSRASAR